MPAVKAPEPTRWLRFALAGATAVMLVLSWPLWTGGGSIPNVPFVATAPRFEGRAGELAAAAFLASVVMTGACKFWRVAYLASLAWFVLLVVGDQHRFQPWAYQYAMVGLLLAGLPPGAGLRYARWCFIALYVHSALSKFDVSFRDEMGALFLATGLRPFGVDPLGWSSGLL